MWQPEFLEEVEKYMMVLAFEHPERSTLSHLFDKLGRIAVASETNGALIQSLGGERGEELLGALA